MPNTGGTTRLTILETVYDYERRNVGSHRPRLLSDEMYAAARQRSAFDVAIYDDAQALMDDRLNALR